eukprot:21519-Eustigmatos_ZCMA.PRE.1
MPHCATTTRRGGVACVDKTAIDRRSYDFSNRECARAPIEDVANNKCLYSLVSYATRTNQT